MASTSRKQKTETEIQKASGTKAEQVLEFAEKIAPQMENWMQLSNALFGIGGKVMEMFPTTAARTVFMGTPEYRRIHALIDAAPDVDFEDRVAARKPRTANGAINVRLPGSIHAALLAEAEEEGVSLNQLCLAKLAVQLKAVTRR